MFTYEDRNRALPPPVVYTEEGKPATSWRVLILPYLEEDDLYRQYDMAEPWDSPNNLKVLEKMPRIYRAPGKTAQPNSTYYQVFVGKQTPFEDAMPPPVENAESRVTRWGPGVSFGKITDGLSGTIMVVEAGEAVPWTKRP